MSIGGAMNILDVFGLRPKWNEMERAGDSLKTRVIIVTVAIILGVSLSWIVTYRPFWIAQFLGFSWGFEIE